MADAGELERTARITYQRARDGHATPDEAREAVLEWLRVRCPNTAFAHLAREASGVPLALESDWPDTRAFEHLHQAVTLLDPPLR